MHGAGVCVGHQQHVMTSMHVPLPHTENNLCNHTLVGVHTCTHVPEDAISWLHTNFKLIIIMNE